jgi:hypothetical protein
MLLDSQNFFKLYELDIFKSNSNVKFLENIPAYHYFIKHEYLNYLELEFKKNNFSKGMFYHNFRLSVGLSNFNSSIFLYKQL